MRIILYGYEYPPLGGGVANALQNLLSEYQKYPDLQVDFVTSAVNNQYETTTLGTNITIHRIPIGARSPENYHRQKAVDMVVFSWQAWRYTWGLMRKHNYDLTHFFGFPGGLVSLLFAWKWPYIISLRGIDVPGYSQKYRYWYILYRPIAWLVWKFARRVTTNSSKLLEMAEHTYGNLRSKCEIIVNGVDSAKIVPAEEAVKQPNFTVTAGGTILGRIKGLTYLVDGFAKLHKEFPDTRLELIGSGDLEAELRAQIAELQIANAASLLGRQSHEWIEANLPRYHVLCLPSLNEGMSNAMLEGLAAGLPLVITETGGTKEILDGNGIIVPPKDAEAIYQALRTLYLDPALRQEMGVKSRQIAQNMSWQNFARHYYNLYVKVISK